MCQTQADQNYQASQEKQRLFSEVSYAAGSWNISRRVLVKAEHTSQGANPRFVVTNLTDDPPFNQLNTDQRELLQNRADI